MIDHRCDIGSCKFSGVQSSWIHNQNVHLIVFLQIGLQVLPVDPRTGHRDRGLLDDGSLK